MPTLDPGQKAKPREKKVGIDEQVIGPLNC